MATCSLKFSDLPSWLFQQWFVNSPKTTQSSLATATKGSLEERSMAETGTLSTFYVSHGSPMMPLQDIPIRDFFVNWTKRYPTRYIIRIMICFVLSTCYMQGITLFQMFRVLDIRKLERVLVSDLRTKGALEVYAIGLGETRTWNTISVTLRSFIVRTCPSFLFKLKYVTNQCSHYFGSGQRLFLRFQLIGTLASLQLMLSARTAQFMTFIISLVSFIKWVPTITKHPFPFSLCRKDF